MENEWGSSHKIPCSWCIQAHHQNQWLHSTLSEMDRSTKAMQTLMTQEQEGEEDTYYRKKPEILNKVAEFRQAYHILADYCSHLNVNNTLAHSKSSPFSQLESFQSTTNKSSETSTASTSTPSTEIAPAPPPPEEEEEDDDDEEELAALVERAVKELAKSHDEKRAAKRELEAEVERLVEENGVLRGRLREVTHENATVRAKLIGLSGRRRKKVSKLRFVICRSCVTED